MKLFEVADSKNGYVCGFDIYCGKNETSCANNAQLMDPYCTQTTRTVIGLLDSVQLLGKGHIEYLDNFYNSYQLNLELYARDTFVCGMLRSNRKGNSKAVVMAKLKKGEAVYRRNDPVLCLKWCEKKRSVAMMSTVHSAVYVEVKKRHSDDKIMKPLAVYDYTQKMAGVDKHDQFNTYYNPPRRSLKWTTKISFHLLSMCMTNAYMLYTSYGPNGTKLDHKEFILSIARTLIKEGLRTSRLNTPHVRTENLVQTFHRRPLSRGNTKKRGDKYQGKRGQKENQVGLVLQAMDHGQISKIKYYLNIVHEYGVQFAKKFYVQHLASKFFTLINIIKIFC